MMHSSSGTNPSPLTSLGDPTPLPGIASLASANVLCPPTARGVHRLAHSLLLRAVALAPLADGVGRGVWEGVNKAIYADIFPNDSAAAFANITFQSGFAASLAFFVFPELPLTAMAAFVIASAGLAVPGALMARKRLHEQHAGTNAQRTKLLVDDPQPQHRLT